MFKLKHEDLLMKQKLINSIREFGLLRSLTVYKSEESYHIVDGAMIFECARKCDITDFPCLVIEANDPRYVRCMLNLIEFENDSVELCHALQEQNDLCLNKLPFDEHDRETIKSINSFDWNQYHKKNLNQLSLL